MTDAHRKVLAWGIAFLAILAAWIAGWYAAPFPGWDYLFYLFLLAFFVSAYGISAGMVENELRMLDGKPSRSGKQALWTIDASGEEDPLAGQPAWRRFLHTAWVVGICTLIIGGLYYSSVIARSDWHWFATRLAGPEGLFLLAYFIARLRVRALWVREGKPVPEDY